MREKKKPVDSYAPESQAHTVIRSERFRALFDASDDAIFLLENDCLTECNSKMLELFRYSSADEIVGHQTYKLSPEWQPDGRESREKRQELIAAALSGSPQRFLWKHQRADGTLFDSEVTLCPIDHEHRAELLVIVRDITARKEAEEKLLESEERLRLSLEASRIGTWEWNIVIGEMVWDRRAEKIFGLKPGEFDGTIDSYRMAIHKDDLAGVDAVIHRSLARNEHGDLFRFEHRTIIRDDDEQWILVHGRVFRDDDGMAVKMLGTVTDITERKGVETALEIERDRAKSYLELAASIILALDRSGNIILVNDCGCRLLGCAREEVLGKNWFETFLPEPNRDEKKWIFSEIMAGNEDIKEYLESPIRPVHGTERMIRWHNSLLRDESGTIIGTLSSGEDISEQKKAEEKLRDSEARFQQMAGTIQEIFWMTEPGFTKVLFVSPTFEKFWQCKVRDLYENPDKWIESIHPDDINAVLANRENQLEGLATYEEFRIIRPDGSSRWISNHAYPVMSEEDGKVRGVTGIAADITKRKKAEEELQRAFTEISALKEQIEAENILLREEIRQVCPHGDIIGQSDGTMAVIAQIEQVARTDSTVLILGETGTGKELVARSIHEQSGRNDKPFVIVNCAAMPATLVESELFGHERGAFTGALDRCIGRFEAADGGNIFLDEIGELPAETQAKLLRVLQEGQFERLGSHKTVTVDVRVVAATNRDLEAEVREGRFREDLYYRLNVFPISIPPLRERKEDIPELAWAFIDEFSQRMGKRIVSIPKRSMETLERYSWPGNIRELRNVIERAMIRSSGGILRVSPPEDAAPVQATGDTIEEVERQHILGVLKRTDWRVRGLGGAAEILGLKPTTLDYRIKKLKIIRPK